MKPLFSLVLAAALSVASAAEPAIPYFDNLGDYSRPVTTGAPEAQRYFDQGMRFLFGFNHGAALRSFREAAWQDSECAMAYWGIALACGPHINDASVSPARAEEAWQALAKARQYADRCTPIEQALIEAQAVRYAWPAPADRSGLDLAYADAMRRVWQTYPKDADAAVLFAEALLDLRPWDQWTPAGEPQPGTEEAIATLEAALALDARHPLANHLYIHAIEASPHPERAIAAADRLRDLQPGLAHNLHMPSHIDIRVGEWRKAIVSNLRAIEADQAYRRIMGPPRDFVVIYAAHNRHMLAYAAMMTGQSELALHHIRAMVEEIPEDFMREWAPYVEGLAAMPYEVLIRFGRWEEILAQPEPAAEYMHFTRALRQAARAIALAAQDNTVAARDEQARFLELVPRVPAETVMGNNPAAAVLAVAVPMVDGEILVREGQLEAGFAALRQAVQAEDALRYDEPPGWILPVRHALGANLMAHGRFAEAEAVYREDLERLPNNGWSLLGLGEALRAQQRHDEADVYFARHAAVWGDADVRIRSSCFCQPMAGLGP